MKVLPVRDPSAGMMTKLSSCLIGTLSTRKNNMQASYGKLAPSKCLDALNREFAMGVTSTQVTRHYRHYKENWQIVERALNNSGNGFDTSKCKLTISESEKAKLRISILHLKSSHYCH